jgi:heat shock protein HtpX
MKRTADRRHDRLMSPEGPGPQAGESARRRRRSQRHAALMLMAMAALIGYCGWIVAGVDGVVLSVFLGGLTLLLIRQMPLEIVLRAIGARLIAPRKAPVLYAILDRLCRHAGLGGVPALYVTGTRFPAAFTIGAGETAAIVLSQGLLADMMAREIRGVLAHEVVHIRNGDIALMQLATVAGQLARLLAQLAFLLLFMGVFLHVAAVPSYPLAPLLLLIAAPLGIGLLQRALSREREGEADLEAAELTGDPASLAMALVKMRRREQLLLEARFPGARLLRVPALLRDHPATEERIRRLRAMPQGPDAELNGEQPPLEPAGDDRFAWPWE